MIDISVKLKELRAEKNLKQSDVANAIGIARTTLAQYEIGVKRPSYEVLVNLAEFFNVSVDYLLGRSDF